MKPFHLKASPDKAQIYVRHDGANKIITLNTASLTEAGRTVWAAVIAWFDSHNIPQGFSRSGSLSIDITQGVRIDDAFVFYKFPIFLVSAPVKSADGSTREVVSSSTEISPPQLQAALAELWKVIEVAYGFESYFSTEQGVPTNDEGNAVQAEDFDTAEERSANPSLRQRIQLWYSNTFGGV